MKSAGKIKSYYQKRLQNCADDDLYYQVGKTQYGKKVPAGQIDRIVEAIQSNLQLSADDHVLDIGCANGLLSYSIAEKAATLTGIDLSEELIRIAGKYRSRSNISYFTDDIFSFNLEGSKINKIYMYEVLQHFSYGRFRQLLRALQTHLRAFRFFIGGIPDAHRLFKFYNDDEKKRFYFNTLEQEQPHMGTWWYADHLQMVCEELGLASKIIEQHPDLYTAHYRFDFIVWTVS